MIRKFLLKLLTPKNEEEKSMDRINNFLKRNNLTIQDLQKIIVLTLGNDSVNNNN